MNNFTIISYYTNDWKYKSYAQRLIADCERLNLPYIIKEIGSKGDYLENCKLKPAFIRDCLDSKKSPVVWIDVDGSILQYPSFFESLIKKNKTFDFAAKKMKKSRDREWHVGTLLVNYGPKSLKFLDHWISLTSTSISDEHALDRAYKSWPKKSDAPIIFHDLPREYFVILKSLEEIPPSDTIICHRLSEGQSKKDFKRKMRMLSKKS